MDGFEEPPFRNFDQPDICKPYEMFCLIILRSPQSFMRVMKFCNHFQTKNVQECASCFALNGPII